MEWNVVCLRNSQVPSTYCNRAKIPLMLRMRMAVGALFVQLASVSGVARYMATVHLRLMYISDVACNMATVHPRLQYISDAVSE